jgi:hypothetical protein
MADVTLEDGYHAETGRVFQIAMGEAEPKGDDLTFTYTSTPEDGGTPFIFQAIISKALYENLGFDKDDPEHIKKLRKITAFKGLEDLKRRLNGGHDENFDNLPYIKMYSLRDKPGFEQFM